MQEPAFFPTQDAFNDWMEDHCTSADELWVGYYKKNIGRQSISWSASVDVALCLGWIDGIRKSIDDQSYKIRFPQANRKAFGVRLMFKKSMC